MRPRPVLTAFDRFLATRGLELDAIVVGGAALALLGVTDRQTRDCDILHPDLPAAILRAAAEFAGQMRTSGTDLADDWLNNGPSQLTDVLPQAWELRLRVVFAGEALHLRTLARSDLLKVKLFALCDRGTDLPDCLALAPSSEELAEAEPWVARQDGHPDWPAHVEATLADLGRRLGHGV